MDATAADSVPQYYSTSSILGVDYSMCSSLPCEPDCKGNCQLGKLLHGLYDFNDHKCYVEDYKLKYDVITLREAIDYSLKRPATAEYFWLWVSLRTKEVVVVEPPTSLKADKIKCSFVLATSKVVVNF